uniref:Neuroblastoma-amplified sequence N-terminal domain-containing protein n=1 Tax=Plectus sambesii TaxID=2011161 RepID=A0A914VGN4_9BILA
MDDKDDSDAEKADADVSVEDDDQLLLERQIVGRWNATIWHPHPLQNLRNTLLQTLLIKRIESLPLWKVAFAPKQNLAALLTQEGDLEISSVDTQLSLIAKVKVLSDPSPDWCLLEWTASENLLISSRSNAVLDVFESSASFCYSIPLEGSLTVEFDAMRAVCQLTSRATSGEPKWLDELFVLQYNGRLRCFKVGRLSGYHPMFEFDIGDQLSVTLTNTMCLLPASGLLLVSSPFRVTRSGNNDDNYVGGAADVGLSAWRLVDTEPYLVPLPGTLTDASLKANSNSLGGLVGWLPFLSSATSSAIVCMAMNPSQSLLVFVTANGDVGIFHVPSFKPKAFVPHRQSSSNSNNERFDIPVQTLWWSDEEVVILFASGALKMCSTASVDNLSEQVYQTRPLHLFSNCAKLLVPAAGLCFIHECQKASSNQMDTPVPLPNENRIWLAVRMSAVTLYGWMKIAVGAAVGQ